MEKQEEEKEDEEEDNSIFYMNELPLYRMISTRHITSHVVVWEAEMKRPSR